MKILILFAALLSAPLVHAEALRIPVPGQGWSVKLEAPALTKVAAPGESADRVYSANADKLNVTLTVSKPLCEGGSTPDDIYKCFGERMQRTPYILDGTIRAEKRSDAVQVMYMMEVPVGGAASRVFNINYLFAHKGKWGDLQISIMRPEKADLEQALHMAKSLVLVDD